MVLNSKIKYVSDRIASDYLMPPRGRKLYGLLRSMKDAGYTFLTVQEAAQRILDGVSLPPRCAVLRHDIDTDPGYVDEFLNFEKNLGIRSTYYFRLCTYKDDVVERAANVGSEVSYHFEEIATFAKEHHLVTKEAVHRRCSEIKEEFSKNLDALRRRSGLPMVTVASHGDFANRKLGIINNEILLDKALRKRCNILCEAYDKWFEGNLSARFTDAPFPRLWNVPYAYLHHSSDPIDVTKSGSPFVLILVHPRQWRSHWPSNTHENLRRIVEGRSFR